MTPRERITILLEHYRDVLEGIYDRGQSGSCSDGCRLHPRDQHLCARFGCANLAKSPLAMMCRPANHPSYRRLMALMSVMHERWPRHRQALRSRFERYSERRVAWCQGCGANEPIAHAGEAHARGFVAGKRLHCRHGGRVVTLQPRIVRVVPADDSPRLVDEAIGWLVDHWGEWELDIPEEIHAIERERALLTARAPKAPPVGRYA